MLPSAWPTGNFGKRLWNTIRENWYLGFTSFGGPPVHFKIFREKFVDKLQWIDEQVYQELFSVCQAFSGPGSTKMLYCINLIHDGFLPAALGFLIWSLPGALGMLGLAIGVSNIGESLPRAVYALLSGLNAATVGVIALAAVQLAEKAITDKLTRSLVFLGAAAGMLYNALWYFPLLMLIAGIIAVVYDFGWLHKPARQLVSLPQRLRGKLTQRRHSGHEVDEGIDLPGRQREPETEPSRLAAAAISTKRGVDAHQRLPITNRGAIVTTTGSPQPDPLPSPPSPPRTVPPSHRLTITWPLGLAIIGLFIASFAATMTLRGVLASPPLLYRLFANMYLAGTIIFGGGPVVIPLLREYVVAEGWVTPRDFLIGLALIQGFPGPNFNFAVYLGAVTAVRGGYPAAAGAVLGYLGIFVPGLVTVHGTMGIWSAIRRWRWVKSGLRGVNAAAVGLIYTAVYRLWQIGYIDEGFQQGASLANDPWWVVVTATSYVGGCWFGVSPPLACILGAVLGLIRYGVVQGQAV
ncbi:chromate transporter-domain-containing protein [Lasiosphaeris hirsuta]|uniref:Chromate transporter-domain-containing protein n=1 Tax=Lasiosphaeris hirsuta TaxID=260670 RepID=A0AA40BAD5_9PEZI|nr:chromate transporter-domain-containing protein [Lasiosphaeris hirsuta]